MWFISINDLNYKILFLKVSRAEAANRLKIAVWNENAIHERKAVYSWR